MPIIAKGNSGGEFQIAPPGQFAAICQKVIDFGHIHSVKYGKTQHKVLIGFEIHGLNLIGDGTAYMADSKPFVIQREFTLNLGSESNPRAFLESWRAKPFEDEEPEFDISKLIGVCATLTINHSKSEAGRTYANIVSITPLQKTLAKPQMANPALLFELDPWDESKFESLGDYYKKKITESEEFKERFMKKPVVDIPFNDEIPF